MEFKADLQSVAKAWEEIKGASDNSDDVLTLKYAGHNQLVAETINPEQTMYCRAVIKADKVQANEKEAVSIDLNGLRRILKRFREYGSTPNYKQVKNVLVIEQEEKKFEIALNGEEEQSLPEMKSDCKNSFTISKTKLTEIIKDCMAVNSHITIEVKGNNITIRSAGRTASYRNVIKPITNVKNSFGDCTATYNCELVNMALKRIGGDIHMEFDANKPITLHDSEFTFVVAQIMSDEVMAKTAQETAEAEEQEGEEEEETEDEEAEEEAEEAVAIK